MEARSYHQIKYDCRKAYKQGVRNSIIEDIKLTGMTITNYEYLPKIKVAIAEVKRAVNMPSYIEQLPNCWEFRNQYPL